MIFAGGCEELDWTLSVLFDAMGAMSSSFNQTPDKASRAYDKDRDGFVIAGGAGVLVLEELEHAKARGAKIYAEVAGYGATSDGHDMVAPSGEGAMRCMKHGARRREAAGRLHQSACDLDADRRHQGDRGDPRGVRRARCPPISATKSLTGHSLGAAGVQEAIYSLLMMNNGFICESANIENLDPAFADMPIVRERRDNVQLGCVLSNSFGFGGTNASRRVQAAGCVTPMLFMVIERFRDRDAKAVYRRFREQGRMMPDGLHICRQLDRGEFRPLLPADGVRRRAAAAGLAAQLGRSDGVRDRAGRTVRRDARTGRRPVCERSGMTALMQGKRGLIMGVANDHSIAWGIAQDARGARRELAFTYQGEALGKRVKPLAESVGSKFVHAVRCRGHRLGRCGVRRDREAMGHARFLVHAIGFSDKNELKGRYADTSRDNFSRTMVISCFSFTEGRQARRAADAERRRDADADLQRRRAHDAELQRHGPRQGGAGGLGALSRGRFRRASASASTRSRPARSARSRAPASATRARCSRSSRSIRRSDAA